MADHPPSPDQLRDLVVGLERIDLTAIGEVAEARRRQAVAAAWNYLGPRLADKSGTIVVAVVGPAGGGKSTIVNSIAQRRISDTGPLRPTTVEPMSWTTSMVPATFDVQLGRSVGTLSDSSRPPPEGVVIVDTPPLEVLDGSGVPVVRQILEVADAVVFVVGATRYADADAFSLLEIAAERGLRTVIVLNRLPETPELQHEIAADFAAKLAARRLLPRADTEFVTMIAEGRILPDTESLAPEDVAKVTKDIEAMADPQSRPDIVAAALLGSFRRLRDDLAAIRGYVMDMAVHRIELLDPMRSIYRAESDRLIRDVQSGKLTSVGGNRLIEGLVSAATRRAGLAARASAELWRESAPAVIDGAPDLFGHGAGTLAVARERLSFWLAETEDLPRRVLPRRFRRRRRLGLIESVRLASIDPRHTPDPKTARRLARAPGLIDSARARLSDELRGILETDSLRFVEQLGPAVTGSTLTELSMGDST